MQRFTLGTIPLLLLSLVSNLYERAAVAQEQTKEIAGKVLDLVFRVEDLGGKVQDLQVKETGQEIRIELAADVLFDFDKSDILPKAQAALKQAATIIREKPGARCGLRGTRTPRVRTLTTKSCRSGAPWP